MAMVFVTPVRAEVLCPHCEMMIPLELEGGRVMTSNSPGLGGGGEGEGGEEERTKERKKEVGKVSKGKMV